MDGARQCVPRATLHALLELLHSCPALPPCTPACLQSIERHQADLPLACLAPLASRVHVLQVDNVRLTTQVRVTHAAAQRGWLLSRCCRAASFVALRLSMPGLRWCSAAVHPADCVARLPACLLAVSAQRCALLSVLHAAV